MLLDYHSFSSAIARAAAVALSCSVTLSALPEASAPLGATLSATASVSVGPDTTGDLSALLDASALVAATPVATGAIGATLAASCSISSAPAGEVAAAAQFAATALVDASASISVSGSASLGASATLSASLVQVALCASSLQCAATLTARPLYTVPVSTANVVRRRGLIGRSSTPPTMSIKEGDTIPSIEVQLVDGSNVPVDLTGAARIDFRLYADSSPRTLKNLGACAIVGDPANGTTRYHWTPSDTDTAGNYLAEVRVVYLAGGYEIMPDDNFIRLNISENLDES